MSDEKKTLKPIAVLTQLVSGVQDRVLWLSNFARELKRSVEWVKDEVRLKTGGLQHSIADQNEILEQLRRMMDAETKQFRTDYDKLIAAIPAMTTTAATAAFQEFVEGLNLDGKEEKLEKEFSVIKAEAERQRILGVQRADLLGKNYCDLRDTIDKWVAAIQKQNERLSAAESRLVVAEGQARTLGECLVAANGRISFLEKQESKVCSAWHLAVGVEKRVAALEDANKYIKAYNAGVNDPAHLRTVADWLQDVRPVEGRALAVDKFPEPPIVSYCLKTTLNMLYRALPSTLRLMYNPSFQRNIKEAGFEFNPEAIIALVQKLVDEHEQAVKIMEITKVDGSGFHFDRKDPQVKPSQTKSMASNMGTTSCP